MSTAQLILFLDPSGTIRAEMPGVNGHARQKVAVDSGLWPPEIVAALRDQQFRLDSRDAKIAAVEAEVSASRLAESAALEAKKIRAAAVSPPRTKIWDQSAGTKLQGADFASEVIGPRRRGKRTAFLARSGDHREFMSITCVDETPGAWCRRNGWELKPGSVARNPRAKHVSTPRQVDLSLGVDLDLEADDPHAMPAAIERADLADDLRHSLERR
jgi:hypothetical protein